MLMICVLPLSIQHNGEKYCVCVQIYVLKFMRVVEFHSQALKVCVCECVCVLPHLHLKYPFGDYIWLSEGQHSL